jgi:hypothetical protein
MDAFDKLVAKHFPKQLLREQEEVAQCLDERFIPNGFTEWRWST